MPRHRSLIVLTAAATALAAYAVPAQTPVQASVQGATTSGWTLRWADEFSGTALNTGHWTAEHNSTFGDGNSELACLTDRWQNLRVADGSLHLIARRESTPYRCGAGDTRFPDGRHYTSAMVHTSGKASWRYGRFEIRAKTATATESSKGLWGAAWFKPTDHSGGEIDLLEALGTGPGGGRSKAHQALHASKQPLQQNDYALPSTSPSMAAAFHTYAMEWSPSSLRWYVDGVRVWTRDTGTTSWFADTFRRPYFLRLNLAVGGTWPGAPTADTAMPAEYVIDYVRVYSASG